MRTKIFLASIGALALLVSHHRLVTAIEKVSYTITVTATVGEPKLTLFGYTSPFARIQLSGIGVLREATGGDDGYFQFNRVFLPAPTLRWVSHFRQEEAYPDLSLIAIDTENRSSFPVSLPPLPLGPYEITVGPVLLSPTITLEKGVFRPKEQIIANGQTIPNSKVTIALANQTGSSSLFGRWFQPFSRLFHLLPITYLFPSQTYANFIPKYQIQVKDDGRFQFNLPANDANTWRVFASTFYLDSPSPKSNTLTFEIQSWWRWLWEKILSFFLFFFNLLKPHLLLLFILAELAVIGLIFISWKKSPALVVLAKRRKKKFIAAPKEISYSVVKDQDKMIISVSRPLHLRISSKLTECFKKVSQLI